MSGSFSPMSGMQWLLLLVLAFVSLPASARDRLDVRPVGNFDFGSWTLAGSLETSRLHCLSSADTPKTSGFSKSDNTVAYSLVLQSTKQSSSFNLYQDGVYSTDVKKRLRIRAYHQDILAGGGREELLPATREKHVHVGQFFGCPNGANSQISIAIAAADLASVNSGVYQETFSMTASNPDAVVTVQFTVSITVNNGGLVQISGLNSVSFGVHAGIGDVAATSAFCVHSSALGNGYKLTINPSLGSSSAFTMVADSDTDTIPLSIAFAASGSGGSATEVKPSVGVAGVGDANQGCKGTTNARLEFLLRESDLQAASSGRYSQLLVVLVEPI